jgi:hypothetical protein
MTMAAVAAGSARPPPPDEAPIFVVGTGRSGTTLLRAMLSAHPRIYLTHEASFYVTAATFPAARRGDEWLDYYLRTLPFAWLGLDPGAIRAALPERFGHEGLPDAFRAIMREGARRRGKPRYGDKTPFHASHLGAIFRDFPGARVIHAVRDPRPTVASLARMPWAPGSLSLCTLYYAREHEETAQYRDRMLRVRLEDLLSRPREIMRGVLDFVGEEWDDAVLDHARPCARDDVPPFPWLLPAAEPRREAGAGDPASALSPAWIRRVEARCAHAMRARGYEPAKLACEPSFFERARAALADLPVTIAAAIRFARVFGRLARYETPPVAEVQSLLLGLNPGAWRHYPGFRVPEPGRFLPQA